MKPFEKLGRGLASILSGIHRTTEDAGSPSGVVNAKDVSLSFVLAHAVGLFIAVLLMALHLFVGLAPMIPNPILSGLVGVILTLAVSLLHRLGQGVAACGEGGHGLLSRGR